MNILKRTHRFLGFGFNYFLQTVLHVRIKPRTLQFPITNRCNSRCLSCGIWQNNSTVVDIDPEDLKKTLANPFFSKVSAVGLNGGEPSLYPHMSECLSALFTLKRLKRIYVITNGVHEKRVLEMMKTIKNLCASRNIKIYLTVSIDGGTPEIYNQVRGIASFHKVISTLKTIAENRNQYCDVLNAGCTLSRHNIEYVKQTEVFLSNMCVEGHFHLAVPNLRLHNARDDNFNVLSDTRAQHLATMYFFECFKYGKGLKNRLQAFCNYYYLLHGGRERLAGCNYLRSDVTLTENMDLCLCAKASHPIGNMRQTTPQALLENDAFKTEELRLQKCCNSCIHYVGFPTLKGIILFIGELLKPKIWFEYKLKCKLNLL
jgi:MoaA/NifB/PqqE/SkfB family radical SAM enzyme